VVVMMSGSSREALFGVSELAVMLEGKPHGKQGKAKGWSINRDILNAVLDFAEA